jgi:hypothetical protein
MLTDQIKVGNFRVPVEEQEPTDTESPAITGGYLLEIDGFANSEPLWFQTPKGLKITVKYPDSDDINVQQKDYIRNYLRDFETVLFSVGYRNEETGYRTWVDEASLVNWYIACELTGNSDSFWSTYLYKKRNDGHIYFGPLWDYDIAFNNDIRLGDATQKLMRTYAHAPRTWVERFWTDEWFRHAVNERWTELVENGLEDSLIDFITQQGAALQSSQQMNFGKWNILNRRVYDEVYLFNTYNEGVDYLKSYIRARIAFLTGSFERADLDKPSDPFVAENYYYRVMNERTNNVIASEVDAQNPSDSLSLWSMQEENADEQLWKIEPMPNYYFRFVNKSSNLAMAGAGRGNKLVLAALDDNDAKQLWRVVPVLTGNIYGIVNVASAYSVNNSSGSFSEGNPVIEWDNNAASADKPNQHWYIQKVERIQQLAIPVVDRLNPAVHWENNQLLVKNLPEQALLQVYNLQGLLVAKKQASGETILKLPGHGFYLLRIITKNNALSIKLNIP